MSKDKAWLEFKDWNFEKEFKEEMERTLSEYCYYRQRTDAEVPLQYDSVQAQIQFLKKKIEEEEEYRRNDR